MKTRNKKLTAKTIVDYLEDVPEWKCIIELGDATENATKENPVKFGNSTYSGQYGWQIGTTPVGLLCLAVLRRLTDIQAQLQQIAKRGQSHDA